MEAACCCTLSVKCFIMINIIIIIVSTYHNGISVLLFWEWDVCDHALVIRLSLVYVDNVFWEIQMIYDPQNMDYDDDANYEWKYICKAWFNFSPGGCDVRDLDWECWFPFSLSETPPPPCSFIVDRPVVLVDEEPPPWSRDPLDLAKQLHPLHLHQEVPFLTFSVVQERKRVWQLCLDPMPWVPWDASPVLGHLSSSPVLSTLNVLFSWSELDQHCWRCWFSGVRSGGSCLWWLSTRTEPQVDPVMSCLIRPLEPHLPPRLCEANRRASRRTAMVKQVFSQSPP